MRRMSGRQILAGSSLALLCNFAGAAQSGNQDAGGTKIEEIVVTGSMLISTTAAEEGAAPVEVISVDEIRSSGATTVFEALRSQPQLAGLADNDTRSGAQDTKEVNLRGLGAQYTLVLINGRRIAQNNLNLIPFAAVERVEILKDGASAVYGSDALAGVVNVILREDFDGFEFSADYGSSTHYGDGSRINTSFLTGLTGERGSMMLSGQYEKHNSILSLEHPLGRSDDQRPFGGPDLRVVRNNPGLVTLANGSRRMLAPSFGAGETGSSAADYVPVYDQRIDKRRPNNLQNDKEVATILARGKYDLIDERVELFADFLYKSGKISYVDHRGTYLDLDVPATNFWNPFGQDVHVRYLLDYGTAAGRRERALETLQSNVDTTMFTAGLRGTLGPVDYSLAYTTYETDDVQTHEGLSRASILDQLARTDSGALNLFGNAAVTAEQLAPARAVFHREFRDFVRSITGLATFAPFELPAGPVGAAVGFEVRNQGTEFVLDEALSRFSDSISLPFLNDFGLRGDRDVDAYFAEVNLPLAGDASSIAGVRALDLSLAARRESFSDFGDATVKRATLRWQPLESDALAVRASYSESFYAPELFDLQPLGDSNLQTNADPLLVDAGGNPLRYDMTTISGGNPNLDPTTGEYMNVGFILKPSFLPGFSLTADVWKLDQKDAFVYPLAQAVINGDAPGTVVRDPVALPGEPIGRITTVTNRVVNAATRNVAGVDLNIAYSIATDVGHWSFASYNTYTSKFEYDNADGADTQSGLGLLTVFGAVPRLRSNLVISNEIGPWNFTVGTNYFGKVKNTFYQLDRIAPYVTTDLTVTFDFARSRFGMLDGTVIWLNVDNVFDEDLPFVAAIRTTGLPSDYSYADYVGQFVTMGFRTKF